MRSRIQLAERIVEYLRQEGITDLSSMRSLLTFAAQLTFQLEDQAGVEAPLVGPQSVQH
jgi:hypothetical protein